MNQDVGRSRALRWILLSALAMILLLAAGVYWGSSNRARPQTIVGEWILYDPRAEVDDGLLVTFRSTGVCDLDREFATRWHFADGQIHFRYWRKSDSSSVERWFSDTLVYSWLTGSDGFRAIAEFDNEERTLMTLMIPGEEPRLRLRRIGPEPGR